MDCVFCKIINGELPSDTLYQNQEIMAFRDIKPMAPIHILIIPKKHIPSLADLKDEQAPIIGEMVKLANELAHQEGISKRGYRLVISSGIEGGQVVPHLHMHLLGGRELSSRLY
jgi:histidine triad (HIT) family protein